MVVVCTLPPGMSKLVGLGGTSPLRPGRRECEVGRRVEVDVLGSGRVLRGAVGVEDGAGEAMVGTERVVMVTVSPLYCLRYS